MKHTSGPWKIGTACGIQDSKGNWIGEPSYSVIVNDETESHGPSSVASAHLADAQLIAAAPELLEACKVALRAFENNDCIDWNELKRAIAKAEGGE